MATRRSAATARTCWRARSRVAAGRQNLVLRVHGDAEAKTLEALRDAGRDCGRRRFGPLPPLLDAAGDRRGFILDVLANYDVQDLLPDREGDHGRPGVRQGAGAAGDRALRHAAPAQPRAARRDRRRALPRTHGEEDRRQGEGDGRDQLASPRGPDEARDRQVRRREGLSGRADARRVLRQGDRRRRRVHRAGDERLPRVGDGAALRRRRLPGANRGREVPDRLRPAAPAHDVRGQRCSRG